MSKQNLHGNLATLRDKIEAAKSKRTAVASAFPTREEIDARLEQVFAHSRERLEPILSHLLSETGSPRLALLAPGPRVQPEVHMERLLTVLCEDRIREVYAEAIDQALDGRETISAEDRATRLAELDAELLTLECAEEALIEKAEAAAIDLPRRADASPAAVLGWPEEEVHA
jgi:hypothetical protein